MVREKATMAVEKLIISCRTFGTKTQQNNRSGKKLEVPWPRTVSLLDSFFSDSEDDQPFFCDNNSSSKTSSMSSLKVKWRKDRKIDEAIQNDKKFMLCYKVIREVLKEPDQTIPLKYLEKRRERIKLKVRVSTFLKQYPGILNSFREKLKPKGDPVPVLRPSAALRKYLEEVKRIQQENEPLLVEKLYKLLMMSCERRISAEKLVQVKRDFGFPDDFLTNLVPRYPKLFRLVEGNPPLLEIASENPSIPLSVIERRAEEDSESTGRSIAPSFVVHLPKGMTLRKEMIEWTRDWIDRPYISPFLDCRHFDPASPEMEKRTVGVIHEVLSLCVLRRMPVPILGKFCDDFRLPNAFVKVFTRHPGIFYLSLKGGIRTAMLREAYDGGVLIDREPLLAVKEKFCQLMKEALENSCRTRQKNGDGDELTEVDPASIHEDAGD